MLTFSYTLFPTLKKEIENIDSNRDKILCLLIPPQKEIVLRFQSLSDKTSSALFLAGKSVTRDEVAAVLEAGRKNPNSLSILEYKNANDYLIREWFLSDKEISGKDIMELLSHYADVKIRERKQIDQMIDFITVNPEHGIIQAALVFVLISQVLNNDNNNIKLSSNVSNLFMYKYGYDFRGLLNIDEYWANDLANLQKVINESVEVKNLSAFLEYFVSAISIQSEKALKSAKEAIEKPLPESKLYELNTRQRKIISLFDKPGAKVSNRDVQKAFKVSQITASRDLARLATLGLIFQNGRGRSVFYTKV